MATYAIGDLQGCSGALDSLLRELKFDPGHDRLWFVGDLVNRGPDSAGVLRRIKGFGDAAVTVLGNHDLRLLAVAQGCVPLRIKDTFRDILTAPDGEELLSWLRQQPLIHQEGHYLLLHAGLLPQWTPSQALTLARDIRAALRGPNATDLLRGLYESDGPQWSESLSGMARLICATNVLTRLRVCTPEGTVDWAFTGPPDAAPRGYVPWFQVAERKSRGAFVICGHWSALGLSRQQDVMLLDSGCVWQRRLSAFRLEDGEVVQVSCSGRLA